MPGTPPTSPVHGAPRYVNSDASDFAGQVNAITDRFDITAMRLDTGLASARPGTGPGTGAWYYATDTRQLSRWSGTAWETNLPNAHAASHQDGGADALTVREAMMATGALGMAKGSFSAYRNAALSLADGATVICDTDSGADAWDLSNWYDVTTGRFTPQIAGDYRLNWCVTFSAAQVADVYIRANLYKNGANHKIGSTGVQRGSVLMSTVGTGEVSANGTTDFFTVVLNHSAGTAQAVLLGVAGTYFQGQLIGRS